VTVAGRVGGALHVADVVTVVADAAAVSPLLEDVHAPIRS